MSRMPSAPSIATPTALSRATSRGAMTPWHAPSTSPIATATASWTPRNSGSCRARHPDAVVPAQAGTPFLVPGPVVQIRIVRMTVAQPRVAMHMRMRLAAVPGEVVSMGMVRIVHMLMRVRDRLVQMLVLMALAHIEPSPDRHQRAGGPEDSARVRAEDSQGERRAEKWRHGKIRTGACGAEVAERHDEEDEAHAVADEADQAGKQQCARRRQTRAHRERDAEIDAAGD